MNKNKIFKTLVNLFVLVCVLSAAQAVSAQTCINLGGADSSAYATNFDALGTSLAPRLTDADNLYNITNIAPAATKRFLGKYDNALNDAGNPVNFPGWALVEEGANIKSVSGRFDNGTGSSAGGNTYSYGSTATSTDRALGSLNDEIMRVSYLGGCFVNNTGNLVSTVYINFTGELWRRGDAENDRLAFQYAVKPAGVTPAQTIFEGTFTDFPALDFSAANTTGTGIGGRDGNAAENRKVFSVTAVNLATPLAAGQYLYLRWVDRNIPDIADDGLAIDDFGISLVAPMAAQVSVSGRVVSQRNTGISGTRITLTDTAGNSRTALTNSSGYYRFTNLPVGTYIVNVRSKHFAFNSTQVVTFNEDRQDLNFTVNNR